MAAAVDVSTDDLSRVVDGGGLGVIGGQGIGKCGVCAATQEKAVGACGGLVKTYDLTRSVDALCKGIGSRGSVQRGEDMDWHDPASSDRLAGKG